MDGGPWQNRSKQVINMTTGTRRGGGGCKDGLKVLKTPKRDAFVVLGGAEIPPRD